MGTYKDTKKEEILDQAERLYIMGFRKPYVVQKLLKLGNINTAKQYLKIAQKRAARRNKKADKEKLFQFQLTTLDVAQKEAWQLFITSTGITMKTGALNALMKIMKQKAELLGLEAPQKLNLLKQGESFSEFLAKLSNEDRGTILKIIDKVDMERASVGALPTQSQQANRESDLQEQPKSD